MSGLSSKTRKLLAIVAKVLDGLQWSWFQDLESG